MNPPHAHCLGPASPPNILEGDRHRQVETRVTATIYGSHANWPVATCPRSQVEYDDPKTCFLIFLLVSLLIVFAAGPLLAQAIVAPTEALTPADQQKKFHLPPGFELQLVACEPDLHKPMNMKFDRHGRLWVTHSVEYPFVAKSDAEARDRITIFSNFAADGRAQTIEPFGEHLNIPIGIVPLSDREAITWSIPNIYRLQDTNGDGIADERSVVLGPFDIKDVHGNQNGFTRWIDGWIYANHGFGNHSLVKLRGEGAAVLEMDSGNVYRFRTDGSAIEHVAGGQANPFGLCFDALGNMYNADCHSRPVTMILRDGFYHFYKPHDGLGFAPEITDTEHGGTGIAGVAYSGLPNFPAEYRDVLFVGNVITNRVHCDRLTWSGSSPNVTSVQDFLSCDDPWFRPVDVQMGPDGALYIADFYNRIIGHYEAPLDHPLRDRERGRIWRVVYTGRGVASANVSAGVTPVPKLAQMSLVELLNACGHPNLTVRTLATNETLDRFGKEAATAARQVLQAPESSANENFDPAAQRAHLLWIVARGDVIDEPLANTLFSSSSPIVRVHLLKTLGEFTGWQPWHTRLAIAALADSDPTVRRASALAIARHAMFEHVAPLLQTLTQTSRDDEQLFHALRIAVRNQVLGSNIAGRLPQLQLSPDQLTALLKCSVAAPTGPVAQFLYDRIVNDGGHDDCLVSALVMVGQQIDLSKVDSIVAHIRKQFPYDNEFQIRLLRLLNDGLNRRGASATEAMTQAYAELFPPIYYGDRQRQWTKVLPVDNPSAIPWGPQERSCSDGELHVPTLSSRRDYLVFGQHSNGTLSSPLFKVPATLSFWMCGHLGALESPPNNQCYARLVLEDGTEVARSYPPRSDLAKPYTWNLTEHVGKLGHVELVDLSAKEDLQTWIGVCRFEPLVVSVPPRYFPQDGEFRAEMIFSSGQVNAKGLLPHLLKIAGDTQRTIGERVSAANAVEMIDAPASVAPLSALLADTSLPIDILDRVAEILGHPDSAEAQQVLLARLKTAPQSVARTIALALARRSKSAVALIEEIRAGRAPAALLREPPVVEALRTAKVPDLDQQISELTANLSAADDRILQLINARRAGYLAAKTDVEQGRGVFARSVCVSCHRIGEVGKTLAPALDGIGNRGLDRLLEDILDPNRNVDQAFRTVIIETSEGQIVSGFGPREEGQVLVLNNSKGESVNVPLAQIAERTISPLSPMPANAIEQIPEADFYNLIAYLLSQRSSR
jgi:putative heme-binding domain-containing protein